MECAIDTRLPANSNNPFVESLAEQLKAQYRQKILECVFDGREREDTNTKNDDTPVQTIFRQIENTVTDLRSSETASFERHIKKLSRLLHEPPLEPFTQTLAASADLEEFLKAGHASQGGMAGSAVLRWPNDQAHEIGLVIRLVDSFAERPNDAASFAHTFYYSSTNSISRTLQNMVSQMIVPFARDFIDYVKSSTGLSETTFVAQPVGPAPRKVFVVHGHDEGTREAVARFLERIGFEAIILHEQATQGRTVIEKIEVHGDVGFAVILLTPDDEGNVKGEKPQPRARQNVLIELGYFVGRLGRSRVVALKKGELEIPSDFGGVVYENFDASRGWQIALGRELQATGFEIDWNRIHKD